MRFKKALTMGAAALCVGSLMLTGCSSSNNSNAGGGAGGGAQSNDKLDAATIQINEQSRDALADGGTLRLSVGNMGGNFNPFHNDGNTADNSTIFGPMYNAGCWKSDAEGNMSIDTHLCESVTNEMKDGKQVITFKLKPDAAFNDGTPMDIKMFKNQNKVMTDEKSNVTYNEPDKAVESIEQGADDHEIVVTMKTIYEPYQWVFESFMHPSIDSAEKFNEGWVEKIDNNWLYGPFKLDKYDSAKKTMVLVRNDKWRGETPKLEKIIFTEMDSKAEIAAYKNGQLDLINTRLVNRINQVKNVKDNEFRKAPRAISFGMVINTGNGAVKDKEVRKAIFQAVDRAGVAKVRFNGLDWTEELPGSWIKMPFSKHYQNNYPIKDADPEGAKETLTNAGYTLGSDGFFAKEGKTLEIEFTMFGEDPTMVAVVNTIVSQMKAAGIKFKIDQRGEADFSSAMAKRDWQVVHMGYSVGFDATSAPGQFWQSDNSSNLTGCGTKELDEMIKSLPTMTDGDERNKKAMEVEGLWHKECYAMLSYASGPDINATNKWLANIGDRKSVV